MPKNHENLSKNVILKQDLINFTRKIRYSQLLKQDWDIIRTQIL